MHVKVLIMCVGLVLSDPAIILKRNNKAWKPVGDKEMEKYDKWISRRDQA